MCRYVQIMSGYLLLITRLAATVVYSNPLGLVDEFLTLRDRKHSNACLYECCVTQWHTHSVSVRELLLKIMELRVVVRSRFELLCVVLKFINIINIIKICGLLVLVVTIEEMTIRHTHKQAVDC